MAHRHLLEHGDLIADLHAARAVLASPGTRGGLGREEGGGGAGRGVFLRTMCSLPDINLLLMTLAA